MKKTILAALFLAIVIGSYLLGYRSSQQKAEKGDPSELMSSSVVASKETDTSPVAEAHPHTATDADSSSVPAGTVSISPEKQQLMGVRVGTVEKAPRNLTLRVLGRVAPDENHLYRIKAATDGFAQKVFPFTAGSLVKRNELLASFYSSAFLTAIKTYVYGTRTVARYGKAGQEVKEVLDQTGANYESYRNALRDLGMSDYQLDEITRTQQVTDSIDIRAPAAGFILTRSLSPGQRVEKGAELYLIADLSKVWIVADVFENEAQYLPQGKNVKVALPHQKRIFQAKVSNVLPQFDEATRTLKVRLEADNPDYTLKPNMFVDIELSISVPSAISVPADAVLDSGLKKTVFVDRGKGAFEPREVETGWRIDNRVEITSGLKPGEKIVLSGNFLIDSESRLALAASGMFEALSKDPVCGMDVSRSKAEKAGWKVKVGSLTYYFCSQECKEQFSKKPAQYVKKQQ